MQADGQWRPTPRLLRLEHPQIGGHQLRGTGFQELVDRGRDLLGVKLVGQFFHASLAVMRNTDGIKEIDQEILVTLEEPNLQNVFRGRVARLQLHGFDQPIDLGIHRLALDEHGPQPPLIGQGNQGSLVNLTAVLTKTAEDVRRELRRDGLEQLKGFHKNEVRG